MATSSFSALLLAASLFGSPQAPPPPPAGAQDADAPRIERLILDLGADSDKRDPARQELKSIGKPAIPFLRKAARDPDAERAMAARSLLLDLEGKDGKPASGSTDVRVVYHDWAKGIDFVRDESGRVTLTAPERDDPSGKREFKTYQADSLEEFKKRYPEIARKYDVDKLSSPEAVSREVQEEWRRLREQLGLESKEGAAPGRRDDFLSMERWLERHDQMMRRRLQHWGEEHPAAPEQAQGRTLGILAGALPPALRSQLNLGDSEGLLVHHVQPGSAAERSGLRAYDILLRLNRQPIKDLASFRSDVAKALSDDAFTLEILRGGKPLSIEVHPAPASK
jgi:hypothetical protein